METASWSDWLQASNSSRLNGLSGHLPGQWSGNEGEPGRLNWRIGKELQGAFGGPDQATGIGPKVDDQASLRQQSQQPDYLVDESIVIVEIEGPDAQVADLTAEWPGGQHVLHRGVEPLADLHLAGTRAARSGVPDHVAHKSGAKTSFLARRTASADGSPACLRAAREPGSRAMAALPGVSSRHGSRISVFRPRLVR